MFEECILGYTFPLYMIGVPNYCLFDLFIFSYYCWYVVCPDPVLALKSPAKYKTARLGMLCSKLSSLS